MSLRNVTRSIRFVPRLTCMALTAGLAAGQQVAATSPSGSKPAAASGAPWVALQQANPGLSQAGHLNITGVARAWTFVGDGSYLTTLNASNVVNGTLADARLSGNVSLLDALQTFSAAKIFAVAPQFTASAAPFTVGSTTKVDNLNADRLDGFDSTAFLQSLPNPLSVTNSTPGGFAVAGQTDAANGTGVYGLSSSSSTYGIGIAGASNFGPGMLAISYGGEYPGLSASSGAGNGVTAYGGWNGVEGRSTSALFSGVHGQNDAGGVGAKGQGFVGAWGDTPAPDGVGVYGTNPQGLALLGIGDAYVTRDLIVGGSKLGYVVDLVRNGDSTALEPGDLVEIVGSGPALVGDIPVIVVRRATSARPSAILGPVDCAVTFAEPAVPAPAREPAAPAGFHALVCPRRAGGSIAPGAYANVVTLGSFRALRVDASYGAIRAGDLLVASPNPGCAMADADPRSGTVVGKALADWAAGMGVVPVLVGGR